MTPRWPSKTTQDGSKMVLESVVLHLKNHLIFGLVLVAILINFGSQNASLWATFVFSLFLGAYQLF